MKMYKFFRLLIGVAAVVATACSSDDDNGPTPGEDIQVVTEKGTPAGEAVTKTIGADGGVVESADGQLRIDVPPGALSAATPISIQPITNEAPLGVGAGYRLQPEGTKFAKPVKLTFAYNDLLLNGTTEDFLWVVTQASDGHWGAMMNSEINKETNTVSVEAKHFSDWTIGKFVNLSLAPNTATLEKNESLSLRITGFSADGPELDDLVPLGPMPATNDDELEVLTPLVPGTALIRFKVKNWTLNGTTAPVSNSNGSLSASNKTATYTAPGAKPSRNPVAVSVTLEDDASVGLGSYMLTTNISIVDNDLFLFVRVDGQEYVYYQYGFNGIAPPDPTDMYISNCGRDDDGLQMGGSHVTGSSDITASFVLSVETTNGKVMGLKKFACILDDGHDEAVFGLGGNPEDNMQSRYTTRKKNKDDCNAEDFCADFSFYVDTFEETGNAIGPYRIHGTFKGTLYSEKENYWQICKSSDEHSVEGEFNLIVVN